MLCIQLVDRSFVKRLRYFHPVVRGLMNPTQPSAMQNDDANGSSKVANVVRGEPRAFTAIAFDTPDTIIPSRRFLKANNCVLGMGSDASFIRGYMSFL